VVRLAPVLRYVAAAAVLAVGIDHYVQYTSDHYDVIPTIGTLFLLNFLGAVAVALAMVLPLHRIAPSAGSAARALATVGGLAIAGGSIAGLLVSEHGGLFGFQEVGYRPAVVLSLVLDGIALALLVAHLAAGGAGRAGAKPPRGGGRLRLEPRSHGL
jgi:hypothetical protein